MSIGQVRGGGWRLGALVVVAGCGGANGGVVGGLDVAGEVQEVVAGGSEDLGGVDGLPHDSDTADTSPPSDRLDATTYCEQTVEMFCGYYVRCGRMAVPDLETCRTTFLEACNARYEPVYAALAERGALTLSASGIASCSAHLASVSCATQINDLDGCPGLWVGGVPEGGACGPGIESFICDDASVCVLGLDFCGRCKPLAAPGAACDPDHRCRETAACVEGACVERGRPGDPCDAAHPCAVGVACAEGRCGLFDVRPVGAACGGSARCQYGATCKAGVCVQTGLLGAPCDGPTGCASGRCAIEAGAAAGTCVALLEPGSACTSRTDCRSGACDAGVCAGFVSACLP